MSELKIKKVNKYNLFELLTYISLRMQVFMKELRRKFVGEFSLQDFTSDHYIFLFSNKAIGTARIISRINSYELGRFAIKKEYRYNGYGKICVDLLINSLMADKPIKLFVEKNAQEKNLIKFYQQSGFILDGIEYLDKIPYTRMTRNFQR